MDSLQIKAGVKILDKKFKVVLSLIAFIEDGVTIIYSPALELSGYGYSDAEAKKSFTETLHEFLRYTSNKKTLEKVLSNLGWVIKDNKTKTSFTPPKDSDLVLSNTLYNEIVNKKSYTVSKQKVEFAI